MSRDFGWALAEMRAGRAVKLPGWDAAEWITIRDKEIVNEDGSICAFRDNKPLLATNWALSTTATDREQ